MPGDLAFDLGQAVNQVLDRLRLARPGVDRDADQDFQMIALVQQRLERGIGLRWVPHAYSPRPKARKERFAPSLTYSKFSAARLALLPLPRKDLGPNADPC